jgi:hypothetical protein
MYEYEKTTKEIRVYDGKRASYLQKERENDGFKLVESSSKHLSNGFGKEFIMVFEKLDPVK